jgi:MFS family permease
MTTNSRTDLASHGTASLVAPPVPSRHRSSQATSRPIIAAQAAASVAVSAVAAAGGLLATDLSGPTAATTPLGALVVGSGVGAIAITRTTERCGRGRALCIGYRVAVVGAVVGILASRAGSLAMLLAGTALIGVGNSAAMLSRYALADLAPTEVRARKIGTSLLAVAGGSILGPLLLDPAARAAAMLPIPPASGSYVAAGFALLLASWCLNAAPTPARAGRTLTTNADPCHAASSQNSSTDGPNATRRALFTLATANLAMVTMMAVYPSHLHHVGHSLGTTSLIVSAHICSMFAASPALGRLTDTYGANRVAAVGGTTICTACLITALLPADHAWAATVALVILGLGWNAQLVSGSALLTNGAATHRRARLESHGELAMSIAAAAGALVLAPLLLSQTGIRPLAAAMVPVNAFVVVSAVAACRFRAHNQRSTPEPLNRRQGHERS